MVALRVLVIEGRSGNFFFFFFDCGQSILNDSSIFSHELIVGLQHVKFPQRNCLGHLNMSFHFIEAHKKRGCILSHTKSRRDFLDQPDKRDC